ncbi:HEPN domain-containing protein [Eubacterium ventriosum]
MRDEYIQQLDDARQELESIREWINKDRNKFDIKTKYLVSYAVVKASGSIEVVFKKIVFDFLSQNVREETGQYLEKMILDSSCNPNTGNMSNMLQNISGLKRNIFDQQVKESEKKDKLNSLVQLRNDFAHGDNVNISINTVITYYDAGISILNILDNIIGE